MNATPPMMPAFIPDAGAAAASAAGQATPLKSSRGTSFAGALKDVDARAARKSVAAKGDDPGEPLPAVGNPLPPPLAPGVAASVPAAATPAKTPSDSPVSMAPVSAAPLPTAPSSAGLGAETADVKGSLAASPAATAQPRAAIEATAESNAAAAIATPAADSVRLADPGKRFPPVSAAVSRPALKATAQPARAALNAADDSGNGGDADTGTAPVTATTAAAPAVAAAAAAPADTSEAAVIVALADPRGEYSKSAGNDANDAGAAVVSASAVAGASLTDASMKASVASAAQSTAGAAQATLPQGVVRADKQSGSIDPALPGGAGANAAGVAVAGSMANAPAAASAAPIPVLRVTASVDGSDFPQDLSARVSWMVDNNINGAKLQVNPPQLGPIEVRILVNGDHAQVWMSSHSAVTRDALESSTPQLREMLGTQGFGQVSVDISQRSFQERSAYSPPYEQTSPADRQAAGSEAAGSISSMRAALGAVDAYA